VPRATVFASSTSVNAVKRRKGFDFLKTWHGVKPSAFWGYHKPAAKTTATATYWVTAMPEICTAAVNKSKQESEPVGLKRLRMNAQTPKQADFDDFRPPFPLKLPIFPLSSLPFCRNRLSE
jgi:hypothetical protein